LTAKQAIYSSKLAITDLDKKPWSGMADPDATVYRYFKVSYDKDNSVKSAKLKVSVKKSWLKANDVDPYTISLYRYATTWTKLDTKILKEDGEDIYFEVTTPGFSYFSLGGANGSGYRPIAEETPAATTTTTTLKPTTTTTPAVTPAPQVTTPPPVTKPPEEKGGICGPTVVVLLAMVVLVFTRGMREMKRLK